MRLLIGTKLVILIGIEVLLIAGSFGYLAAHVAENQLLGNSINIAGKNRFLTASVLFQVQYHISGFGEKTAVEESLQNLAKNIVLLRDGGEAGGIEVESLPASFIQEWNLVYEDYLLFDNETRALISTNAPANGIDRTRALNVLGDELVKSSDLLVTDLSIFATDNTRQLMSTQILLGVLNIGVNLLMLYLILRILKPIKLLTKAASAVRDGNLEASVTTAGKDELGELSESFNSMVSSLRESTRSLALEKNKYQDLYDGAPDLYRVEDLNGILIDCNKTYVESLGYSRKDELLGKSIFETTAESSLEAMHKSFEEWKDKGTITNNEVWLKRKDGSTFPTLISATAIHDETGTVVASNTAIIDVTEIFETKRQLENANARLTELDRMKTEFISVASHELRTPIQPILSAAALVRNGDLSNEKAWEIVTQEAKRLQRLASDILDVARIEGGDIELRKERFCVNEIIRDIVQDRRLQPRENVVMNMVLAGDDDAYLDADKSRIMQVMNNLLGNAIKFTRTGSITVLSNAIYDRRYLEIYVKDTGGGIPEEILPKLFSKFASKSVLSGTEHGTGLGLFICKKIVEAHGGSIVGFNNDSGGSTFRILLPASRLSTTEERPTYAQ
jgi:PAS domain S-box-containing protein